ncbi:MAG: orotidine-5'-phosphate decarboxylase [Solirubrobacteraceae bacterium]
MPDGNRCSDAPVAAGEGAAGKQKAERFGDRVAELVARRESQLVLGLDPDPLRLWPDAIELAGGVDDRSAPPANRAATAVVAHCRLVIDAVGRECVAVKLQVACFERLGAPGWQALAQTVDHARAAGLLVIADAKRGDIGISAAAYAQAFLGETPTSFGTVAGLGADALTVNPWLGADALEPFVEAARKRASGLFVLVRNSNPGASDLQDLALSGAGSVSLAAAALVDRLGSGQIGDSGLSAVGAVVGATVPQLIRDLREAMPHAIFLIPGVGAQGGSIQDLAPAFRAGPASALISASRAIVDAHRETGGDPATSAAREAARLRDSVLRLVSPSE